MPTADSWAARAAIIKRARRTRERIEQIFIDAAYWNDNVRKAGEEPIDPDPDGMLRRLASGIDRMLADDTGSGAIPPVGGWLNPLFGRTKGHDVN